MRLKKLEVNSFAGINPQSPVVIDFTQSKFVVVEGNNGLGKTSLLNALLVACGQLSKDNKNFINNESGKIDIDFDFVGKDRLNYHLRCTKSALTLTYEGAVVPEPVTKLKELLGVVGVSPMDIKNKPLKDIVRWLAAYLNKDADEYERQLNKLKIDIKSMQDSRATANKTLKGISEYLDSEEMYLNWDKSEKKHSEKPDIKKLSKSLDEAKEKSDTLISYTNAVNQLKVRRKEIEDEIDKLMKEADQVDKRIINGDLEIEKIWSAKEDYDEVKKEYDDAAKNISNYNHWQDIKTKNDEKNEFETLSQKADAREKELLQKVKDLQAEILPDIKNVELITEDTFENGKQIKEGLYWNGKSTQQLSESEWWKLVMEIWRKYKVKIIIIDNYQSLGTLAVEILEKLAKDGAFILAAEMNRKQQELTINYE